MARFEIKGEQYPVGELFGERFAFAVPAYQRSYAWTTEHAEELLSDLLGYLGESQEPVQSLNPYFLGSIVLIKGDRPDAQIVDGQQRLLTLTILLAVLRALLPGDLAESITRRLYEPADPLNNLAARYRVRPKERDVEFFQTYIQSEGAITRLSGQIHVRLTESQRNMRDNALLYLQRVGALAPDHQVRLAQFIVQRCLLVAVSTPDFGSAYRIFSVLNDRGLDLTTADILKAEVIGQIPEHAQPEYTVRWDQAEESLGTSDFCDLFGHVRRIYGKSRVKNNILDDFRVHVIARVGDARRVVDDVLLPLGTAFFAMCHARYEHNDAEAAARVNDLLRWLNEIDNTDWVPPALLYLSLHHDQPERLVRFFIELERLAASLMIRRQYANKREQRYNQLLAAIESGDNLSQPGSPIQLRRDEQEATLEACSGDLYLMAARPRNYVLKRLDSCLAGTGATYDRGNLTVEHVLPRTVEPGSEWARWFPTLDERARYVHRLGNLVLLARTKNAQASNYAFAKKKQVYFASHTGISPYALTT
ncbi:MAG: DUF262 domain-containing protein [Ktedonobacterales bacterium]